MRLDPISNATMEEEPGTESTTPPPNATGADAGEAATETSAPADASGSGPRELPQGIGALPCIEQPSRCLIDSVSNPHRRLTTTKRGAVQLTKNRGEKEQFFLLPVNPPSGDDDTEEASASCATDGENDTNASGCKGKRQQGGPMFYLKSYKFGRYLASEADGTVTAKAFATKDDPEATPDESAEWILMKSPHGGHFLVSAQNERNLACSTTVATTASPATTETNDTVDSSTTSAESSERKQRFSFRSSIQNSSSSLSLSLNSNDPTICLSDQNDPAESWNVELVTGELCFLSAPSIQKHLRCDMLGSLTLTSTAKGWEVWRFIEAGGGKLRICSWMHSQHFLCSDPHAEDDGHGSVVTRSASKIQEEKEKDVAGGMDEWYVEKAPGDLEGVVVRSASAKHMGDFMCHSEERGVFMSVSFEEEQSVWNVNAGHSQKYSLASLYNSPKTLGPFPYVTDNKKQLDVIVVEQLDVDGTVRLYHTKEEKYMGSDDYGEVWLATDAGESEVWKMDNTRADGGYVFTSVQSERMLSYRVEGQDGDEAEANRNSKINPKLCTVAEIGEDRKEVWRVDPVLPRAVSSGKIKTFAIGTSIAVGTTVAMPFAMAGLAAVIGTESILMGVVTVGLTGAEAIASVGAIGATAAICFRGSGDTLALESEHGDDVGEEEKDKPYMKRPLCAWRVLSSS